MATLTKRQAEIIDDNLQAYIHNFGYIYIEKADYGTGFYVYTDPERKANGSWTQYCVNIDYLNGWLYGAVQAANGIIKKVDSCKVWELKAIFENGDYFYTKCYGTKADVEAYYVGNTYNFGTETDSLQKCISVEFLN